MKLSQISPILICVDLQMGFLDEEDGGRERNNPNAEKICSTIIEEWRKIGLGVIHVRHSSTDPNSKLHKDNDGFEFNPMAAPLADELVITKSVNSSFIGTNLREVIDGKGCNTLVIVGLTTDHCVSSTTRMAGNYGYNTYLISDATACFNRVGIDGEHFSSDVIHKTALASLNGEFATVIDSKKLFVIL